MIWKERWGNFLSFSNLVVETASVAEQWLKAPTSIFRNGLTFCNQTVWQWQTKMFWLQRFGCFWTCLGPANRTMCDVYGGPPKIHLRHWFLTERVRSSLKCSSAIYIFEKNFNHMEKYFCSPKLNGRSRLVFVEGSKLPGIKVSIKLPPPKKRKRKKLQTVTVLFRHHQSKHLGNTSVNGLSLCVESENPRVAIFRIFFWKKCNLPRRFWPRTIPISEATSLITKEPLLK